MKIARAAVAALFALLLVSPVCGAIPRYSTDPDHFVSARLGHFWVNGRPFRFTGYNIRGMVHFGGNDILPWSVTGHRQDNLAYMQSVGARVARVFVSCKFANRYVTGDRLDATLAAAAAHDVYLIVCFTDLYNSGFCPSGDQGYYDYSSWNLLNHQWFTADYTVNYLPQVTYLVNRFKNDPTVFAWQLGNELKCPWNASDLLFFSHQAATAIRAIDSRHMVSHGTAGRNFSGLTWEQAVQLYQDFDFLTIHPYNGDESLNDSALASALGKPLLVSEAGFSSDDYDYVQRPAATDADIAKWISRGARGYMNWGLMATDYDMGDGDFLFGIDRVLTWKNHHLDWAAYTQVYTNWSAILANTPPPAPQAPESVAASDGAWTDRVKINWSPIFPAEEYAVYRADADAQPSGGSPESDVNLLLQAISQTECGHYDETVRGEFMRDGSLSTKWCCAHHGLYSPGDHWTAFDLGGTCRVTSYVVKHASMGGEPTYLNTKSFYIESAPSMSGPWTTEFYVNNPSTVASNTRTYGSPKNLRYIRLRVTQPNPSADWAVRIPEFEVWGTRLAGAPVRISDWQAETAFTDTSVIPGKRYFYSVQARNEGGSGPLSSPDEGYASDVPHLGIAQAKLLPEGDVVCVIGGVVSAVFADGFYIQQPDSAAGIGVMWSGIAAEGDRVRVLGPLVTMPDGQRWVHAFSVSPD